MTPLMRAARALALKESGTASLDALKPELQEQVIKSVRRCWRRLGIRARRWSWSPNVTLQDPASVWPAMIDPAIAEG
jgi:hypothetical protein